MPTYRAPNVHIEETPKFPQSVVELPTRVVAFIGHTEKAAHVVAGDLTGRPTRITSLPEYEFFFGGAKAEAISISVSGDATVGFTVTSLAIADHEATSVAPRVSSCAVLPAHYLFHAVQLFFANGGGPCYIVSIGDYNASIIPGAAAPKPTGILGALATLETLPEPALVTIPEAVRLSADDYASVMRALLTHCEKMGNRFAILDVQDGAVDLHQPNPNGTGSLLQATREMCGTTNLEYGALYYPFLRTTASYIATTNAPSNVMVTYQPLSGAAVASSLDVFARTNPKLFTFVVDDIKKQKIVVPPGAVVAGAYAATDSNRGVWKAPANITLTDVLEPVVMLNDAQQDDLNVDAAGGKSINAIRTFAGRGTRIWGARTLLGNDNDWRYINARRFFSMIEQSIRNATEWTVFEANNANTWVTVRGLIENYLTQKWRDGALMGATPNDAFFVRCGLGQTMTAQDILEGRLIVEVGMAAVRPAEFTMIRFSHRLQSE